MIVEHLTLDETVAALGRGEVVALPTDTVYGVGALLADQRAVERLFAVKSRPRDVALPVLVGGVDDVDALGLEWSAPVRALAEGFWPGALTIIVAAPTELAQRVGATDSVGVRWPRHELLNAVLARCGPLAVTSANEHGRAPCTSAADIAATTWAAPVAGVLDAGTCDGAVSSVVEVRGTRWWLRREGAIGAGAIRAVLGPESSADDY